MLSGLLQTKAPLVRLHAEGPCIVRQDIGEDATAMANDAAAADTATALAALRTEVAGLRQGLALMLETQATHTEMLRTLMEAAAAPGESETALSDTLAKIAAILTRQASGLDALQAVLLRLPEDVGQTVAQGVRQALSNA